MGAKQAREKEIFRQDALAISRRFIDCLHQDEFPHHTSELHLFGLGTDYSARRTEVLAVWQGAAKNGDVTVEDLTDALCNETVKDFFEKQAHKLAASRSPNSTYAKALIEAKFATLEWDDL